MSARGPQRDPARRAPAIDTGRYQWAIGLLGLALLIAFSLYINLSGKARPGIAPGAPLRRFVAPLAGSGIDRPANANPRCDPRRPNPRGLNVCGRSPLVLAFFIAQASGCVREVATLQRVAPRFPAVQFAAVAVRGSPGMITALARSRRWRIPVAYDEDGRIAEIYGVETCPMIYLIRRGGIVAARLLGDRWLSSRALAARVRGLLASPAASG